MTLIRFDYQIFSLSNCTIKLCIEIDLRYYEVPHAIYLAH
jgi:hypothetical protein